MVSDQEPAAASEPDVVVSGASDTPGGEKPGAADVQAYIGRQLRAVYDDVVKQPIPDRFLALLEQLEAKTTRS